MSARPRPPSRGVDALEREFEDLLRRAVQRSDSRPARRLKKIERKRRSSSAA
jgi:hypothetical protein